jgi:hypothetical protein
MATVIKRGDYGYGVVEPNHLSAPRDGGVWAQLPAASGIDILENGQFVKYDYASGECNFTAEDGAWMLVFNEEKLYDERYQMHRDYAQKITDYYDGKMYPRVFRISVGDIYTTNCLADGTYSVGNVVAPNSDGLLEVASDPDGVAFKVVKEYTLPDGQPAVKLQCIAE